MVSRTHKTGYAVALVAAYFLFLQGLFASFAMAATPPFQPDSTTQTWVICSPSGADTSSKPDHNPLDVPQCCTAVCGFAGLAVLPQPQETLHNHPQRYAITSRAFSQEAKHSARRRGHPVHPQAPPIFA